MRINLDLSDLEAFLVLFETGSFVNAAEQLGLSQSALTRRISKLEGVLGAALFERTTRSVRPTLAARRLRPRAQTMLDEARETLREMRDETAASERHLRAIVTVATVPSALPRVLTPAVRHLAASETGARVRILDLLANEVAEAVAERRADFGISSWAAPDEGLAFAPVFEDRVVLAIPPDHPLARERGAVLWSALEGERLILPSKESGNRALIDRALAPEGSALHWSYEVSRTSTALELVRAGLGVAPLSLSAVPVADGAAVVVRDLAEPAVSRRIGLVERTAGALPAAARRLRDLIAERTAAEATQRLSRRH